MTRPWNSSIPSKSLKRTRPTSERAPAWMPPSWPVFQKIRTSMSTKLSLKKPVGSGAMWKWKLPKGTWSKVGFPATPWKVPSPSKKLKPLTPARLKFFFSWLKFLDQVPSMASIQQNLQAFPKKICYTCSK